MPIRGFDCFGFMACVLGNDGRFHPVDLSQTVTLSPDPAEEADGTAYCGAYGEEGGDPYHYTLIGDMAFTATMQIRYGARYFMKLLLPTREFRRWMRRQEKARRNRLKEVSGDA